MVCQGKQVAKVASYLIKDLKHQPEPGPPVYSNGPGHHHQAYIMNGFCLGQRASNSGTMT